VKRKRIDRSVRRAGNAIGEQARHTSRLLARVRACQICARELPFPPRPVLRVDPRATILIAGQAPGRRVHESGIAFEDASGERLRDWLGLTRDAFCDESRIAILPMGFCFPGSGRSGDLPPRPECAAEWRAQLVACLPRVELVLAIGQYAHAYHLADRRKQTLTETVRAWREYWPAILPLPHPSPRNNGWLRSNPWFERQVLPRLRDRVRKLF